VHSFEQLRRIPLIGARNRRFLLDCPPKKAALRSRKIATSRAGSQILEIMAPAALTYNATLTAREDLTDKLALFSIAPDEALPAAPWFDPGQYLVIGLNNEAHPELGGVRRPMSIASGPYQRESVEFYIRYVTTPTSNNPLTHLLWRAKVGDRIYLKVHPTGHFSVHHTIGDDDPRKKIFVAAGTGLAPFVSFVRARLDANPRADLSDVAILHGASYPEELGYATWLQGLAISHGLSYLPTISRPKEAKSWNGAVGRVEDFFLHDRVRDTCSRLNVAPHGLSPEQAVVYICGLNGTIASCVERLLARAFVPENIKLRRVLDIPENEKASLFFEQYDTEPVIDVKNAETVKHLQSIWHEAHRPAASA
jgi:ferredoxin--NADP+ reductase